MKAAKRPRKGPTFVQRSRQTSPAEKAQHLQERRPFFGLTPDEAERIGAAFGVRIQARLSTWGSR